MSHPYVVVLSYPDRSGVLGVFGPFDDKTQAAHMAETILPEFLWVAYGVYDVLPLLDQFGFPVTQHNTGYGAPDSDDSVCWDCIKGRHAICEFADCKCPMPRGIHCRRQPEFRDGKYIDPGEQACIDGTARTSEDCEEHHSTDYGAEEARNAE